MIQLLKVVVGRPAAVEPVSPFGGVAGIVSPPPGLSVAGCSPSIGAAGCCATTGVCVSTVDDIGGIDGGGPGLGVVGGGEVVTTGEGGVVVAVVPPSLSSVPTNGK